MKKKEFPYWNYFFGIVWYCFVLFFFQNPIFVRSNARQKFLVSCEKIVNKWVCDYTASTLTLLRSRLLNWNRQLNERECESTKDTATRSKKKEIAGVIGMV